MLSSSLTNSAPSELYFKRYSQIKIAKRTLAKSRCAYLIEAMQKQTRRTFVAGAAALSTAAVVSASTSKQPAASYALVHHVFFWLKNPDSKEDQAKLIEGLRTLGEIKTVRGIHIGVPASTEKRDVVDNSFQASEILYFDDTEGQAAYQTDPIHTAFVEGYSHLWSKVIVYDTLAI